MAKDVQTIVSEFNAHIRKQGGNFENWYVGITQDIEQRLFGDHKVPRKDHWFIHREAFTSDDARAVEKAFLEWGCDGGTGGGDEDTCFVYAYLKTSVTDP